MKKRAGRNSPDARTLPIEPSLVLLESLHARWVPLLRALSECGVETDFRHPELGLVRLEQNAALLGGTDAIMWRYYRRCGKPMAGSGV